MKRELEKSLVEWKHSPNRKPLILQGARQVGKTWLMKEFGKNEYAKVIYANFEASERLKTIFEADFNISRIISILEIETNQKIEAENCLIIFDEIQEAPKGLTALKYFYENAPKYHIIAAGSLLGISMQKKNTFPVGKVDFMKLFPLSFKEFLQNLEGEKLAGTLKNQNWDIIDSYHEKFIELLRLYYFVGGMPEAVKEYIENKNLDLVRNIQQNIIIGYENDFSKYAPNDITPRIRLVWNSIISQLAKENRKFIYGQIKKGARAKEFENAISWLVDAGLLIKVNGLDKPGIPLKAYAQYDFFKLFLLDIGLLNTMANIDKTILLEKNRILTEHKGAMTEQFVCQELRINHELYYWSNQDGRAEIDFLIEKKDEIFPIEVKSEENLKAKSLKFFTEKFKIEKGYRISMSKLRHEETLTNIPLYAAESYFS